ncbi:MAG TPA: hypothetical protein VFS11_04315 [Gemmatimonadales bacterium]|nr:hypothetical protein [Gemmatimonadales bacterium]
MHTKGTLGGIAVLAALAGAPLQAQTSVDAGVTVHSGGTTVGGHVSTGPERAPVVVREPAREVIVVERVKVPRGRAHGWWRKQGYREVRVYSDGERYYPRRVEHRKVTEVIVYERQGRYYRWDEVRDDHHHDHGHKHGKGKGHHHD